MSLNSSSDLAQLEQQLQDCLGGRIARDLVRIDVDGSLNLADQQRWEQLCTDLNNRLLRLRVKSTIQRTPDIQELRALIDHQENPLIAQVATQLQKTIDAEGTHELANLALVELHRLINRIPED